MPNIRLFELLIKLRVDQLDRETAWQKAIQARAEVIAERARECLTNAQRRLIDEVDAGRLPEVGQHVPDPSSSKTPPKEGRCLPPTDGEDGPGFRWVEGLREIDKQAYIFRHHRGKSNTTACRGLAENELENEAAPEWQRHRRSLWTFAINKLWLDPACLCRERGKMFENLGLFDRALYEAALHSWAYGPVEVDAVSLRFLREQDESGYTKELIAALWAEYRSDCEAIPLQEPVAGDGEAARGDGRVIPTEPQGNRIVDVLVTLEQARRERKHTLTSTAARRLLEDPGFVADFIRRQLADPAAAKHLPPERFKLDEKQRSLIEQVTSGKLTRDSHEIRQHGLFTLFTTVESQVDTELCQAEAEDFVERGGSLVDWRRHRDHPLDEYVLERIEVKLSEFIPEPHGALHVFIIRTIEGRAAKHEDIRSALDRLVRVGFADEFLRDVWERYPIEAKRLRLPRPTDISADLAPPTDVAPAIAEIQPPKKELPSAQSKLEWLAKALLTVNDHPEWSDRKIASDVGVDHSTLSRSQEYRAAAAIARGQKTDLPRGFKDSKTGEMDAFEQ